MSIEENDCQSAVTKSVRKTSWFSIIILSLAAIIFVTAELLPIGVLHEIGNTYNKSAGNIGLIVTGYAWVVALSAISATSFFMKVEKKKLVIGILLAFSISNLIVSFAPNLFWLYIGRVIGAFFHGVFWSIVGPLAVRLVPDSGKAKATSLVFGGIAIASVAVVPIATFVSQNIGWRLSFISLAIMGLLITIAALFSMPKVHQADASKKIAIKEIITQPYLRRTFPVTALALSGNYCAFTYISPLLENRAGISHEQLPFFLLLFGMFGLIGNIISGFITDSKLVAATRTVLAIMIVSVIGIGYFSEDNLALTYSFVAMWGIGICLLTVTLQSLVLNLATGTGEQASSVHVAMFNTGIGTGAFIGGILIDRFNTETTALIGGILLIIAFVILIPQIKPNKNSSS
ncbi:MFS transporter [Xenorhabdus bovienii]|uniref:MFS transporter n=1 Tax=Xenorhabdus bovienii TaxID=40576 RepID=A0AAJ1J9X5_XENBV|nr:MFS transporter [Xenorhabdus bovienii]MDE1473661.1 MFS transporter [Xenorhabdus bovienii]MDE1479714.1 MFS transporter [Xenorhabdus bovienii]MDE1485484.1 MFS transporter [Xenorhabdus bovienii]MDE1492056.1 MFS transporter [Xenorhabdus bovienii]MDE1493816.1 MFS transporter [Xenorhabdus bovienii]